MLVPLSTASFQLRSAAAFTMTEMLIASAIGAIIMAGVMTTYIFSVKSFAVASNYGDVQRDARRAADLFTRDMRGVSSIAAYNSSNITVSIPTAFSSSGSVTSNKTVQYWVNQKALYRYELNNGSATTTMLATNVSQMTLTLYDRAGNANWIGTVYAPQAALSCTGNGNASGAFVANQITISGNGSYHYDEALQDVTGTSSYSVASWQELRDSAGSWVP